MGSYKIVERISSIPLQKGSYHNRICIYLTAKTLLLALFYGSFLKETRLKGKEKKTGGCEHFSLSLTNNGPCHTFNGILPSSIWRPSKLTHGLERFLDNYQSLENYGGVGATQGNFISKDS